MGRLSLVLFLISIQLHRAVAQEKLQVQRLEAYRKAVAANRDNELVELIKVVPGLRLDIRYAGRNNFMKRVMYRQARAFARRPVAEKLRLVQAELKTMGLGLKVYDGYRPYAVTVDFYKHASDKSFVANPNKGSRHNRGCALDLTLIDLRSGRELDMATPYDSFSAAAAASYEPVTELVRRNRSTLIQVMEKHGFKVLENEWWHFDFRGWENFALLDIPFEKL